MRLLVVAGGGDASRPDKFEGGHRGHRPGRAECGDVPGQKRRECYREDLAAKDCPSCKGLSFVQRTVLRAKDCPLRRARRRVVGYYVENSLKSLYYNGRRTIIKR